MLRGERGSALLDPILAIVMLMTIALGVLQVALTVYAHDAARSSAYEGARAAAEIGTSGREARLIAEQTVSRVVGGLLRRVHVGVSKHDSPEGAIVRVVVRARQRSIGPVPVFVPVRASATALMERPPA